MVTLAAGWMTKVRLASNISVNSNRSSSIRGIVAITGEVEERRVIFSKSSSKSIPTAVEVRR